MADIKVTYQNKKKLKMSIHKFINLKEKIPQTDLSFVKKKSQG